MSFSFNGHNWHVVAEDRMKLERWLSDRAGKGILWMVGTGCVRGEKTPYLASTTGSNRSWLLLAMSFE